VIFSPSDVTTQAESINERLSANITIFFLFEIFQKIGSLNEIKFTIFFIVINCDFKNA